MSGWTQPQPDRWVRDNDDRHLLLQVGGQYVEHHLSTIHVYAGPKVADVDNPLGAAVWVLTENRKDLAEVPVDDLWAALANADYTTP